jgi:hypothetical protein
MKRKLVYAFVCAASLAVAAPTLAGSDVTGMKVTLTASPAHYTGGCPGVFTFKGVITVDGKIDPKSPVEISYQFHRNDASTSKVMTFTASHTGPYPVSTSWTMGAIGVSHAYAGWQTLEAWQTHRAGRVPTYSSGQAHFTLDCGGAEHY